MYWTAHQTSIGNLDSLYARGVEGLAELLDYESIILKTRNGDEKLLSYLTRPDVLQRLVEYTVGVGLQGETALRFPLIACELLCCEQPTILMALRGRPALLEPLWNLPPRPLPPLLVCWSRLMIYLLTKLTDTIIGVLQEGSTGRDFLGLLVQHLSKAEAAEVLLKLFHLGDILAWPNGTQAIIFPKIFALVISGEEGEEFLLAAQNFIAALLLTSAPADVRLIISMLLDGMGSLLERTIKNDDGVQNDREDELFTFACEIISNIIDQGATVGVADDFSLMDKLVVMLEPRLAVMSSILRVPESESFYQSPGGSVAVLGRKRLEAAHFCANAAKLGRPSLARTLLELGIADCLIDMLFIYRQNNFLHGTIVDFLRYILRGDYSVNRELVLHILGHCELTTKIVKNQLVNDAAVMQPRGRRLANMGHVTLIVDDITSLVEGPQGAELRKNEAVEGALTREDWLEYLEQAYRETKLRDALILGGIKAPPPPPSDDLLGGPMRGTSFTGLFSTGTDEQLARYFCQQVIANLPNRFILADQDGDDELEDEDDRDVDRDGAAHDEDDDDNDGNADGDGDGSGNGGGRDRGNTLLLRHYSYYGHHRGERGRNRQESVPSIEIPVEPNGFDTLLEMEMRLSSLGDDYGYEGSSASECTDDHMTETSEYTDTENDDEHGEQEQEQEREQKQEQEERPRMKSATSTTEVKVIELSPKHGVNSTDQ